jgi:hypothetical protein
MGGGTVKPKDWKNLTDEEKSRCMHSFMEDPRFNWLLNQAHEITGIDYDPALAEAALGSEPNRSAAYVLMASRMVETLRAAIGTLQMREPMELSNIQDMELIAEGLLIDLKLRGVYI